MCGEGRGGKEKGEGEERRGEGRGEERGGEGRGEGMRGDEKGGAEGRGGERRDEGRVSPSLWMRRAKCLSPEMTTHARGLTPTPLRRSRRVFRCGHDSSNLR